MGRTVCLLPGFTLSTFPKVEMRGDLLQRVTKLSLGVSSRGRRWAGAEKIVHGSWRDIIPASAWIVHQLIKSPDDSPLVTPILLSRRIEREGVICGSTDKVASTMSADIGYGNAAGFLFHKGITQKPSGTITEITEIDDSAPSVSDTKSNASLEARHPITSLTPDPSSSSAAAAAAAGVANMTQEEKEREAERLFVLFQRMERNPVLSLGAETDPTPSGESGAVGANGSTRNGGTNGKGGKAVNIEDLMRQKLHSGEHAQMDVQEEQEERERREREEEEDEREVGREMADYRARMSKGRGG